MMKVKLKIFICAAAFLVLFAADGIAQTKYEHHINAIATQVSDNGSLLYRRSDILQTTWPYYSRYFDMTARKNYQESWGVWLGVKDFLGVNDTLASNTVVTCGNFTVDYSNITPLSLQKRVRYPYPVIKVSDGKTISNEIFDASVVVPSLLCDEQIESDWTTSLGITVQLKTYAFASTGQKNYIIYDYRFINTGNIDGNTKTRELNSTLKGVWFSFPFSTDIKPKFGGKDYDDYYQYYGATYSDWVKGNKQADSARVLLCWDGPQGTGDFEPDPLTKEPRVPGFYGVGILHVDKQAADDLEFGASDDPDQPKVVTTGSSLVTSGIARYQNMSQGGHQNISGMGAENLMIGCGPYDIPINEDVNIVLVQIIDGIDLQSAKQLGMKLLNGQITKEQYDKTIMTGRDSLFKSLAAARLAYNKGYRIPFPPPSPDSLTITTGVGRNTLQWSSNAESSLDPVTKKKDFYGYRVYRAAVTPDNTWEQIFECGGKNGTPVTRQFIDTNLVLGFNYYYAVTSFDDGTQNTFNPGVSLESSMLTSTAYIGASASRPAVETSSEFQNNIRVVPNPYNIRSRNFGDPNDPSSVENNKLLFVGLPAKCTIRIYTVSGDLVKKIEHDNGLGSESWNQISDSNQFITSGLYIAQIESPLGNAIVKFVVIR
jgi:hypothetical protein